MEVLFQKFGSLLMEFNEIIGPLLAEGQASIYHPNKHKRIQTLASLFSYQIESRYPRMQHILQYTHSSLLAKYTSAESL